NITMLVTADTNGVPASGKAELASITPDGGSVAFISSNKMIVGGVTNSGSDLYLRKLPGQVTIWASSNASAHVGLPYFCGSAALNANGQYLAFSALGQ